MPSKISALAFLSSFSLFGPAGLAAPGGLALRIFYGADSIFVNTPMQAGVLQREWDNRAWPSAGRGAWNFVKMLFSYLGNAPLMYETVCSIQNLSADLTFRVIAIALASVGYTVESYISVVGTNALWDEGAKWWHTLLSVCSAEHKEKMFQAWFPFVKEDFEGLCADQRQILNQAEAYYALGCFQQALKDNPDLDMSDFADEHGFNWVDMVWCQDEGVDNFFEKAYHLLESNLPYAACHAAYYKLGLVLATAVGLWTGGAYSGNVVGTLNMLLGYVIPKSVLEHAVGQVVLWLSANIFTFGYGFTYGSQGARLAWAQSLYKLFSLSGDIPLKDRFTALFSLALTGLAIGPAAAIANSAANASAGDEATKILLAPGFTNPAFTNYAPQLITLVSDILGGVVNGFQRASTSCADVTRSCLRSVTTWWTGAADGELDRLNPGVGAGVDLHPLLAVDP